MQATPTDSSTAPPERRLLAALPGVLILAAGLAWAWAHLATLSAESLWTDELVSVGDATDDLLHMLRVQGSDIHPPLHPLVLWVLQRLTHSSSELVMRLPSLIAVATGMTVLGLAAWRRLGASVALLFVVLAASSPLMVGFAAQARPHALSFGFVCLATSAWLFLLRPVRPDRRVLAAFLVAGMLASLSQHYGALAFALEAAVLVGWLAICARLPAAPGSSSATSARAHAVRWRDVATTIGAVALALLPLAVWLLRFRQWTHGSGTPPLTLAWAEEVISWMFQPWWQAAMGDPDGRPRAVVLLPIVLAVALGLLAAAAFRARGGDGDAGDRERRPGLAIGAAAIVISAAAIGLAVVQSLIGSPTLHYRSLLSLMPLFQLGLAVAFTLPFGRFAPVAALALALGLGLAATQAPQRPLYGALDQWREAAILIRDEQRGGLPADRVAVLEPYEQYDWLVSLGNAYGMPAPVVSLPPGLTGLRWIAGAEELAGIPAGQPLLVVAFHYYSFDLQAAVLSTTQARFGPCQDRSVRGIAILSCPASGGGG